MFVYKISTCGFKSYGIITNVLHRDFQLRMGKENVWLQVLKNLGYPKLVRPVPREPLSLCLNFGSHLIFLKQDTSVPFRPQNGQRWRKEARTTKNFGLFFTIA